LNRLFSLSSEEARTPAIEPRRGQKAS
jgi:hypothetical protein